MAKISFELPFLQSCLSPSLQTQDLLGQTPLHLACRNKGPTASQDRSGKLHHDMEPCIHRLVVLLLGVAPDTARVQVSIPSNIEDTSLIRSDSDMPCADCRTSDVGAGL